MLISYIFALSFWTRAQHEGSIKSTLSVRPFVSLCPFTPFLIFGSLVILLVILIISDFLHERKILWQVKTEGARYSWKKF